MHGHTSTPQRRTDEYSECINYMTLLPQMQNLYTINLMNENPLSKLHP